MPKKKIRYKGKNYDDEEFDDEDTQEEFDWDNWI